MAIEPGPRRIVVGVDGSAESLAALSWACKEASLRSAEVHAVLALEAACHQVASYAVPAPRQTTGSWGAARERVRRSVSEAASRFPGVIVRTDITEGLAARVLLDHAAGADMLVLGHRSHGSDRPAARARSSGSACAPPSAPWSSSARPSRLPGTMRITCPRPGSVTWKAPPPAGSASSQTAAAVK